MARKRSHGKRNANGRLSRAASALSERNPPNDRAVAMRERFRHFRGEGSIGTEMTCAGRLMLVGAFDGLDVPAESLLEALLNYSLGYWGYYHQLAPGIAGYERRDRGTDSRSDDPRGEAFDRCDERLRSAGHDARRAVHEATVDRHWFPDEDCDWAARIINSRIIQKREQLMRAKRPIPAGLSVDGDLACDSDRAMLDLLRAGAMALAGHSLRKAA